MSFILKASCATRHGLTSANLFENLLQTPKAETNTSTHWSLAQKDQKQSYLSNILSPIQKQIDGLSEEFDSEKDDSWGLILASTKGVIEDQIWETQPITKMDPYTPILNGVEKIFPFSIAKKVCVSNACTSSHGAIELAQRWLKREWADHVFIIAADLIGPFTTNGFKSLRALSAHPNPKPFDINRDGLKLGDAIASCVLSNKQKHSTYRIEPVTTICEGLSATRPDVSGRNLAKCFQYASKSQTPDLLLAHGTGTYYNDKTESEAFALSFENKIPPKVTCSKWSIGHSLGASGLLDLNVALECLDNQKAPGIHTLTKCDLKVSEYILSQNQEMKIDSVLVSSLGFGGVCSAYQVQRNQS